MKRGFTLLELILSMSIGLVIVGTAVSLYVGFMREYSAVQEKQRINNEFMRVNQTIIKKVVEEKISLTELQKPASTCTVSITTETVAGGTLLHIDLSAENRLTHEQYSSALILSPR
jgi:prepilin-type N-terminal cleavage/methylation domain-containing protein